MAWPYVDEDNIAAALAAAGRPPLSPGPELVPVVQQPAPVFAPPGGPVTSPSQMEGFPEPVGPAPGFPASAEVPQAPSVPGSGAAPMVPAGSPYAQRPVPPPTRVPANPLRSRTDVAGAEANEAAAIQNYGASAVGAAQAGVDAKRAAVDREAAALEGANTRRAALDEEYTRRRGEIRERSAVETMKWMASLEENAAREPNPHRYWASQSGFGKSLWLLSMGLSLASQVGVQGAAMRENPVIAMLRQEIKDDVARQRDVLDKQREALLRKGDVMQRLQGERLADAKDDHTLEAERWLGLKEAAKLRASAPGTEDQRAALMAGQQLIDQELLKVAGQRTARAGLAEEGALSRAHSAEQARLAREQNESQFGRELQYKYDALQLSASAKTGGFEPKDLRTVSRNTGFRIVGADGRETEIQVPKEQYDGPDGIAAHVEASVKQSRKLQELRSAYSKASRGDLFIKNDAEAEGLIKAAIRDWALAHNKGVLSDQDVKDGSIAVLGVDRDSLIAKLKGPNKTDTLAWLDKQIRRGPEEAAEAVTSRLGVSLPEGAHIRYTPVEVRDAPDPTAEARRAEAGVADRPLDVPLGANRVREAAAAKALPDLPSGLQNEVERVEALAVSTPHKTNVEAAARANAAIDAWEARHARDPGAATMARHAKDRVFVAVQDAQNEDKVDREARLRFAVGPASTVPEVIEMGHRVNLDLTKADAADLIAAAKKRAAELESRGLRQPAPR